MYRQRLGRTGEALALTVYQAMGYQLVAQRFRTRDGELDLVVARDGLLAFVEVKTRRGDRCGSAAEAVSPRKLRSMRGIAQAFLAERPGYRGWRYRLDVAAVDFTREMTVCRLEIHEGVG